MKLLFKFPTRQRPDVFRGTLEKYYALLSGKHDYHFLITLDVDDRTMNNPDMIAYLNEKKNLTYCFGESKCKVDAINANMECAGDYDILVLVSDDMVPQMQDYDDIICTAMVENFPDMDGSLHFNDGRVGNALATLTIIGKALYDRFGYIYHPDYISLWCDNEFHQVVSSMGKMVWIDQIIIKHDWIDLTGKDSLHHSNENYYGSDKKTYQKRLDLGFPKEKVVARPKFMKKRRR